ncbi:DUF4442 domain-containing protein [Christiangramia crocea]|uniref:DUF4442 domain-containing protein n=1 Tax=Christiangramia crocea TaxID=2904124 RepID=A0A9X1V023_9FLAO|nr:DUF4442 domain-containing protein [Gramella crocea]MCG9972724.1 DUF4442 domain-containing protein [Gramella crocea]
MKLSPTKLNSFLITKIPSAWLCGVRVKHIDQSQCEVGVRHRWINQNPFRSMYWAVQGMAAELSTGALVMEKIQQSGVKISMLVAQNKSVFAKKATGKISFNCYDGEKAATYIEKALQTGEGQIFWMKSVGTDEEGSEVSVFEFEWTVKVKSTKPSA